jgi:hypothetical protein
MLPKPVCARWSHWINLLFSVPMIWHFTCLKLDKPARPLAVAFRRNIYMYGGQRYGETISDN